VEKIFFAGIVISPGLTKGLARDATLHMVRHIISSKE